MRDVQLNKQSYGDAELHQSSAGQAAHLTGDDPFTVVF